MKLAGRVYHKAHKISSDGGVSALCFKSPRRIDLSKASWTLQISAVTCPKCIKLLTSNAQEI